VTMRITLVSTIFAAMSALTANTAMADVFDGSKDLVCATLQISECDFDSGCEKKTYLQADFPAFLNVEFGSKRIVALVGGEKGRTTAIEGVGSKDGKTILQGAENGRAWSMVINQASGDMTATIADIGATFSIFGACTPD
jgi:hypothetical protein